MSALPQVREALVDLVHSSWRLPGAGGRRLRDMGTVIFPDAPLKVFLTASAACRAERRHKQLISCDFDQYRQSSRRLGSPRRLDSSRSVAPLRPAQDALLLDNSGMTVETSVNQVLAWWQGKQPFRAV